MEGETPGEKDGEEPRGGEKEQGGGEGEKKGHSGRRKGARGLAGLEGGWRAEPMILGPALHHKLTPPTSLTVA